MTSEPQMKDDKQASHVWLKKYPPHINWFADLPTSTMPEMFARSIDAHAGKTMLRFMGRPYSYAQIGRDVDRFAKSLQDMGYGKGSKIGICLPNTPFYVVAYYATLKIGATVVNFNPLYAEREIEHQINDSGCELMVTVNVIAVQPKIEKMLGKTTLRHIVSCDIGDALPPAKGCAYKFLNAAKRPFGKSGTVRRVNDAQHTTYNRMLQSKGAPAAVAIDQDDVAVLQYTGGTTGVPKAAALSHRNLTVNLEQAMLWFDHGEKIEEKTLAILPFFHVFSMTVQMNLTIRRGGTLIVLPRFDLHETLRTIHTEKPTMFSGVPTIYKAIIDCKTVRQYDLSSLRVCLAGGAATSENIIKGFKELTGKDIVEGYGLSETSPIATANPVFGAKKVGSIGLPVPQTEIRIRDMENPGRTTQQGDTGEICIRGPQVMKGYWQNEKETANVMEPDGFFRTGDVGYLDEDGYVFIVDRIKDMINASGLKVFPRKVEEAILMHPDVSEVMVAGIDDEYRGETVKAFVVMKEGKTLGKGDLNSFLEDKLAIYEVPKLVDFRQSLPKTPIGKPDRKALIAEEKAKAEARAARKEKK